MQAKDIQNQCRTVNNLDRFAHGFLKIGLLRGRQVVVEDNNIRIHTMHQTAQLLDLSGADKRFRIGLDQALRQAFNALGPSSVARRSSSSSERSSGQALSRHSTPTKMARSVQAPWGPKENEPLGSLDAMVNIINDLIDRKLIHIEPHDAIVTFKPGKLTLGIAT